MTSHIRFPVFSMFSQPFAMSRSGPCRTEWVVVKGTSHVERDSALTVEYRRSQVDSQNNQSSLVHTTHHVRVVVVARLDLTDIQRRTSNRNATACSKLTSHGFETTRHIFQFSQHTQQRQLSRREVGAERMTVHVDTNNQAEDVDSLIRPNSIAA